MPLVQSIANAHEEAVGQHGVSATALADTLARSRDALTWLKAQHTDNTLPLLQLPQKRDDIGDILAAAGQVAAGASDVVVLGTGGSSLGGQTLAQLAYYAVPGIGALRAGVRLHFIDNLDPETFAALLAHLPLATTRFVAISKSGGTGETLMQTIAALDAVKKAGLDARIPELFFGISEPAKPGKRNGLRDLLTAHKVSLLDHDPNVGGRFSVLTNVALLPAALLGLDVAAIRAGAAAALAPVLAGKPPAEIPACLGAALAVALAQTKGKPISVLMAYTDRLERFTRWYVQLWAERPPASPASPARPSATSSPRKGAPPPRRSPRTAARCARSRSIGSTRQASANCSCSSCWKRSSPRTCWASIPSISRRSKRARCWRRNILSARAKTHRSRSFRRDSSMAAWDAERA